MLYLIGLGLNAEGISLEGMNALKKCKKIYLEGYTVDFPYPAETLEKTLKKKIEKLERQNVESDRLIREAKNKDTALLVYGSPLFATTHETLLIDAKKAKMKTKVIYSASVFDAVAETGLQLYKFGRIASMPAWKDKFKPASFMDIVRENLSIRAHSLILVDIGLGLDDALHQLQISAAEKKIKLENQKIVICSRLGTGESKILYDTLDKLKLRAENEDEEEIEFPYCIIIPSELHFMEKEELEAL